MKDLLEYLARSLVEEPDAVKIEEYEDADEDATVFEVSVAEGDYGRVIGKGGRTANAIRTLMKAAAVHHDRRVFVDIVE